MSPMKYMREGMNNSIKKGVVVAVILLFVSVSIISSTGTADIERKSTMPTAKGDTLYVGCLGPGCYSKIQDAIDDASDGDTVFVYDDSSPYYENVVVNKSINLSQNEVEKYLKAWSKNFFYKDYKFSVDDVKEIIEWCWSIRELFFDFLPISIAFSRYGEYTENILVKTVLDKSPFYFSNDF